jgi:hypothetical protein
MNPIVVSLTPVIDADGITTSQAVVSGTNLAINGALVVDGVAIMAAPQQMTTTSVGDATTTTFTFTGTDENGNAQTEDIVGGSTATTQGSLYFKTITSILPTGATAATVTAGSADDSSSAALPLNWRSSEFNANIGVVLSDSPNMTFSVESTLDDVQDSSVTPTWTAVTGLSAKTATTIAATTAPVQAIRLRLTTWVAGTATLTAIQSGS